MTDATQDLRAEMKRRYTLRNTMLRAFKQNGKLTTRDIQRFGTGCSSRLYELRKQHKIVCTYERPGEYIYTYKGEKA